MFLNLLMKLCIEFMISNMNILFILVVMFIITVPIVWDVVSERSRKFRRERRRKEIKIRKSMEKDMD
jgi:hypothetical protein